MATRDTSGTQGSTAGSSGVVGAASATGAAPGSVGRAQGQAVPDQIQESARQAIASTRDRVRESFQEQQHRAADQLGGVAEALHRAADQLRQRNQSNVADYTHSAANQVEKWAKILRERSVDELWRNGENFVRRQPGLFIGGALVAGFFVSRFIKSSGERRRISSARDYDVEDYGEGAYTDDFASADVAAGSRTGSSYAERAGMSSPSSAGSDKPGQVGTPPGTSTAASPSGTTTGSTLQTNPASSTGTEGTPSGKGRTS